MPNEWYMGPRNPCPACGGVHYFTQREGVPFWAHGSGAKFEVMCPETQARVAVDIKPDDPPPEKQVTNEVCSTCGKANYYIWMQSRPRGSMVDQHLRCQNEMCGTETIRRVDMRSGMVLM